ncbi:MAG: ACT domain-containing protein [Planctomycetes bacterium]|nr:ACT domain-containing protein [Planctomycetota bacterium]
MIQQVRLSLPNRPGTLEEAVRALAGASVDMKALEVYARGDGAKGDAHMIVSAPRAALEALRAAGLEVTLEDVVVVEVVDQVGGLAPILRTLAGAGVNVEHLYAFVTRVQGKSLCVLTVDDPARAERLLEEGGHRVATQRSLDDSTGRGDALGAHLGLDYIW